jgi:outer membrane lipoprotein SlyB
MKTWMIAAVLAAFAGIAAGADGQVGKCQECGTVRGVDLMNRGDDTSGKGAVVGAVIGGVVGHQFGSGRGNDAATAGGAVAGAVVGNEQEKKANADSYYRVTVDMDKGGSRKVNVGDSAGLQPGDRVRVSGKNLEKVEG